MALCYWKIGLVPHADKSTFSVLLLFVSLNYLPQSPATILLPAIVSDYRLLQLCRCVLFLPHFCLILCLHKAVHLACGISWVNLFTFPRLLSCTPSPSENGSTLTDLAAHRNQKNFERVTVPCSVLVPLKDSIFHRHFTLQKHAYSNI